jgi:hypothetical protein
MLLEPRLDVMPPVQVYLDSYGPVVNNSTSSWSDTSLQVDGPQVYFTH